MVGERQALNVLIDGAPQIVSHPLTHARRQIFLQVSADGADDRDERDGGDREVQRRVFVPGEQAVHDRAERSRQLLRLEDVVDDHLDRPRLENVGDRFAEHRQQRERQRLPVRAKKVSDLHAGAPAVICISSSFG